MIEIPAKTFLVGEYAALFELPAILLTTTPCFELKPIKTPGLKGIHEASPAGSYFKDHAEPKMGFEFIDPYHQKGGMGASGAQFLSVYRALNKVFDINAMWDAYKRYDLSNGSGYDVIAQAKTGLVYIDKSSDCIESYHWPFESLYFHLIHTGEKIKTHTHLNTWDGHFDKKRAKEIVYAVRDSLINKEPILFTKSVADYGVFLKNANLVASKTQTLLSMINENDEILAAKGCGAMGADVICFLSASPYLSNEIGGLIKTIFPKASSMANLDQ